MHQTGKLAHVGKEMDRYRMDINGISEERWEGSGMMKEKNRLTKIHSAREDNQHTKGLAIIMSDKAGMALMEWKPLGKTHHD